MGLRVVQVCGLWFWVAFTFFVLVVINRNRGFLPDTVGRQQLQQLQEQLHQKPKTIGLTSKQRMARSEAAWRSSVVLRHSMAEQHPLHPKIPFFPAQNNDQFGATPYTVWDFFPATYACPHDIQRVGRLGDGGKWVCGMSLYEARPAAAISQNTDTPETIIYSFGVNDESTFEAEMLARIPSAKIFAYDYSVDTFGPQLSPNFKDRAYFSKVGLGDKDELKEPNVQFHTLSTLMAINNHNYIDILKVDVEGSEYTALDAFMDSCDAMGNMPVGQIMIELHLVDDEHVDFERFMSWWERLEGFGLRPTWLEINLLAVTIGRGKTDPRCVEYVWVNHNDEKSILLMD